MPSSDNETERLKSGDYKLIDNETLKYHSVYLFSPPRKTSDDIGGWIIQWQEATMILAKDKRLNLTDHRVLLVLQSKLDFENYIRLSLSQIGSEIDVATPNVSKSMKKLLALNVVVLGPSVKTVKTYRLNPSIAWKGAIRHGVTERRASLRVIIGGQDEQAKLF